MPRSLHARSAAVLVVLALLPGRAAARQSTNTALDSLLAIEVSSAARYAQTTREAPASISIVTREDIERFGYRSVAETLANLRGFYLTYDRTYTYLGVRGFGRPSDNNNRVLLLVDGLAYNSVINGEATLDLSASIPIEHVERIEVARGPGSALYGSNAMLATVNIVTRRPADGGRVRVKAEADPEGAGLGVASWATDVAPRVAMDGFVLWYDNRGNDLLFPQAVTPGTDGVAHRRDRSDHLSWMVTARSGGLSASVSRRTWGQGDPTAPYGSVFDSPETHREGSSARVDLVYEREGPSRVGFRAAMGYQSADVRARYDFSAPVPDRRADVSARRWGGETQVRIDLAPSHRLVVGAELRRLDPTIEIGTTAQPVVELGEPIDLVSAYVQDEAQLLPTLSVVAGARIDRYTGSPARVSPRVAVVHHPGSGTALKLLFGEAFRAPTPLERFTHAPPLLHRNPELGPERIRTLELVWEQRLSASFQATASAYDYHILGLIAQEPDQARGGLSYQNAEHLDGRGVGLEVNGRLARETSVFGSVLFQSATSEEGGQSTPNSPELLARVGVSTLLPGGLRLGVHASHDASRVTVHGATLGSVTLVNAHLRLPAWGPLEVAATVRNLFDRGYLLPGGTEHAHLGIPQDGRRLSLSLLARF